MTMTQSGSRLEWMDALRGIAILLVLFWHAPAIPALFGYEMSPWLEGLNNFFLPFRMPTLMFLSGLLLSRSMSKGLKTYYVGKFRALIWPYLLWSAVHIVLYGRGLELTQPRSWIATGYLWFLFYIACYYMLAPLVTKFPAWLTPIVLFGASIPLDMGFSKKFLYFAGFFFAGYWAMQHRELLARLTGWRIAGYFAVGGVGFGILSAFTGENLAYRGEFAVFSFMGIMAAIALLKGSANARWMPQVTFVGRNSLIYYVAHFPIILCVLYVAEAAGIRSIWAIAIPGLLLALLVCTLLAKYRQVVPIKWLFQAPGQPAQAPARRD